MDCQHDSRSTFSITPLTALGLAYALAFAGCATDELADPETQGAEDQSAETELSEAISPLGRFGQSNVFVADNDSSRNAVVRFRRSFDGKLTPAGTFPTGGLGTGAGLGSQGAVILGEGGRFLYVVNAGSDEISQFEVFSEYLVLRDIVSSGGASPISLTVHHDLLYVVNAGRGAVPGSISGFKRQGDRLMPLADSTRPLSGAAVGPAQIQFDPWGKTLVVTEKATNSLTTYRIGATGRPSAPIVTPSHGQTPFGFSFDHYGTLIVSEAFGGAAGASAVSSYRLSSSGVPVLISGSVPTGQTAACWVAIRRDDFAFTTNTGSDTVSGYTIDHHGAIERFADGGMTAAVGDAPIDLDFTADGRLLYVLAAGGHSIDVFRARNDGRLEARGTVTGLPASSVGLAAN